MSAPVFKLDPVGYIMYWLHWIVATFGMGWAQAWAFWREVSPDTGMTQYQTVQYLEETQTSREQLAEEKSLTAAEYTYQKSKETAERQAATQKLIEEEVRRQQEEVARMDEAEKAKALREQDEIEQRNQFKQEQAQAENRSRTSSAQNTVNTAKTESEPTPTPITPTPDAKYIVEPVESQAQQDYEREKIDKAEGITSREPETAVGTPTTDMSPYDQYEARRMI